MLSPYIDRCLNPEEQRKVERHLASCQLCQEELASLRATVEWLQQAPVAAPQRSFALAEVRPVPRRRAFATLRVATAVVAVALVAIFSADLLHQFETGPVSQEQQLARDEAAALFAAGTLEDEAGEVEGAGVEAGWVRPVEFSLLGAAVALGGLTLAGWRRQRPQRR